jgi:hypothetical protein
MKLDASGNTVVPAILLIRQMGYTFTWDKKKGYCHASKNGDTFGAEDPLFILGLIKLFEMKGENWKATDGEIEEIMKEIS